MSLCTLAQVKQRLGIPTADTDHDALIGRLISGVSAAGARLAGRIAAGRRCLEKAALTIYFSPAPRTEVLYSPARPIVTVTEIKEAVYHQWDDATALTEDTDFLVGASGELIRIGTWLAGPRTVRASLTGGYTRADAWASGEDYTTGDVVQDEGLIYTCSGDVSESTTAPADDEGDEGHWTLATGEVPLDGEIETVAAMQVAFEFQRRDKLGLTAAGVQGGSFSSYAKDELMKPFRETLGALAQRIG